jgi:hypothetical protein
MRMRTCLTCLLVLLLPAGALRGQHPFIVGSFPRDEAQNLPCFTAVSLRLHFPEEGRQPDPRTVNALNVRLFPEGEASRPLPSRLTYNPALRYLALAPLERLRPGTWYRFELSADMADDRGASFMPYSIRFQTGACEGDSAPSLPPPASAQADAPRPAFLDFRGDWQEDTLILRWKVAPEPPDAEYLVQCLQDSGFRTRAYLSPEDSARSLRYVDKQPPYGNIAYRISLRSISAGLIVSDTLSLFHPLVRFLAYRLPAEAPLPVEFWVKEKTTMAFVLKNAEGQIIKRKAGFVEAGSSRMDIALDGVPPGAYIAVLRTANHTIAQRLRIY